MAQVATATVGNISKPTTPKFSSISSIYKALYKKLLIGVSTIMLVATTAFASKTFIREIEIRNTKQNTALVQQEEKRRLWCRFEPLHEKLFVYVENKSEDKVKGKELGTPFLIDPSPSFENSKPLAVKCREDGTIWWVSKNTAYKGILIPQDKSCCDIRILQKISHVIHPLYREPGRNVIAADIFFPKSKSTPYIATITNDGLLHSFRPSINGGMKEGEFLYLSMPQSSEKWYRWPKYVQKAVLTFLSANEVSIIPIGDGNRVNVYSFYYVGEDNIANNLSVIKRDMKTIIDATRPIYTPEKGWVSTIKLLMKNGKVEEIEENMNLKE
jgi:hypothetical protein